MTQALPPPLRYLLESLPASTIAALAATRIAIGEAPVFIVAAPSCERNRIASTLGADTPIASIDDGQEFSFVIPEFLRTRIDALDADLQVEGPFDFLRLDVTLPWTTVGYGAAIFAALAEAGVSAGMLSGFSTDYLLIPSAKHTAAVLALDLMFKLARDLASGT